jgi:CheY-like chemotaxis protein
MAAGDGNTNQTAQVLTAIAQLLWPIATLFLILKLLPELRLIFHRISESKNLKIKWGDKELSVQEAADNIQKVVGSLIDAEVPKIAEGVKSSAGLVSRPLTADAGASGASQLRHATNRVLWVDDHPKSNALEKAWLENRGIKIDEALTTEEALSLFDPDKYDVVITDMYRKEQGVGKADAGIDLLRLLRLADPDVNVIGYCAAVSAKRYGQKFIDSGGRSVTSDPIELLETLNQYLPRN